MKAFRLSSGCHKRFEDGTCVMECVAHINGEPHSDHPACADQCITSLAIFANDFAPTDELRQEYMHPLIWRIAGTRVGGAIEQQRIAMAVEWSNEMVKRARYCGERAGDCARRAGYWAAQAGYWAGRAGDFDDHRHRVEIFLSAVDLISRMCDLTEIKEPVIAPTLEPTEAA